MNLSSQRYPLLSLYVHAQTWSRDSHGLYDYESQNIESSHYEIRTGGTLLRAGDQVRYVLPRTPASAEMTELVVVDRDESIGERFIIRPKAAGAGEDVWLVVRHLEPKGQILTKNLVLKLGRVRYHVREVVTDDFQVSGSDTASSEDEVEQVEVPGEREESCCRICYEREIEKHNPLLSPCKCDGSVKNMHLLCLKQWLRSKVSIRPSESATTYQWKSLECEICKTELPLALKSKGAQYNLFDFEKPQTPYIVLEGSPSERSAAKCMHVISIGNKTSVKLGRGHDSDVRINDISVSRCHAVIHYENGVFRLEDNSSKFGTLVMVTNPIPITERVVVQVGRSLLAFDLRERSKYLKTEFRSVSPNEPDLAKSL